MEAATREERFAAISELIGAGRVTELQAGLEHSKREWTKISNQRQEELRPTRERLAAIDARLAELSSRAKSTEPPIDPDAWSAWWEQLQRAGVKATPIPLASREAPTAIDSAIKQLDAMRRAGERRIASLTALRQESLDIAKRVPPDIETQKKKVSDLQEKQLLLRSRVSEEQERLAEKRRLQAALEEKSAQLRALADLALRHLDDSCPVCQQKYDKAATRRRLEGLLAGEAQGTVAQDADRLTPLLTELAANEKELNSATSLLRSQEQTVTQEQALKTSVERRTAELLGHSGELGVGTLDARISDETAAISSMNELQKTGESLALRLSLASANIAAEDLRREAETLRKDYNARERSIVERHKTGELAQRVIEAMREASYAVVADRVREIVPLLQDIWSRIDPHPAFRVVSFLSETSRGRGRLSTVLSDAITDKSSARPTEILSSSQLNALAVAVFLALNIGAPKPPLPLAMLDDPLQSLDDVNLLGLVELFRRTRGKRQLMISTHDARFGDLLGRKLRPSGPDDRTVLIHLEGWARQGPEVRISSVEKDPVRLRLVS